MAGEWGAPRKQVRDAVDPSGFGGAEERMRILEAKVAALQHAAFSEFVSIGLDGMKIKNGGSLDVSGDLDVGGTADFSGDTTIGGNLAVTGTLSLPAGIINNDALTNPVLFDGGGGAVTNFAVSTTHATLGTVTKTVPAGCTKMASFCWGGVTAVNSRTVLDFLFAQVFIESFDGNPLWAPVDPDGGSGHTSASKYGILTGLTPGATVTHGLRAWANGGTWSASVSNVADLQLIVLWGR